MIDMDKEFILSSPKGRANQRYIKKNYPNEYDIILTYPGDTFPEKLYNYFHNCPEHICPTCGNKTPFRSILYGYSTFCKASCSYNSPLRSQKSKQTCLERYGVENPSQSELIKKKKEETCLKNFGVTNCLKLDKIKYLAKQRIINKYGVEYSFLNKDIQKKALDVKRKKFLGTHELHIGYDDEGDWICKCPHLECDKCDEKKFHIPQQTFNDRIRNHTELCTKLLPIGKNNKNTTIELFIRSILDEYNIEYETNIRNVISPKELDIYIPSKHIAIECNGVYWHSQKRSNYHENKFTTCKQNGVQLLTIWEDWVRNKPEIIKSILLSKLGIYKERIYARKCIIKEVPIKLCNNFLDINHIQGKSPSSIKLGLYYNNELVSIMTFSKSRLGVGKSKNISSYELVRFCNKLNLQIIGGASKLFKYFIKNYQPTNIYSYSSNDISNGNLYEKLGFNSNFKIASAYWYIHKQTFQRYHRFNFRKQKLKELGYDIEKYTEREIMEQMPYWCIHDSGTTRWDYI